MSVWSRLLPAERPSGSRRKMKALGSLRSGCCPNMGKAYCTSLALAEWLYRTADRIDPARVRRPYNCPGRGASPPDSEILC
jgi:hypothetical protein